MEFSTMTLHATLDARCSRVVSRHAGLSRNSRSAAKACTYPGAAWRKRQHPRVLGGGWGPMRRAEPLGLRTALTKRADYRETDCKNALERKTLDVKTLR